MYKSLIELFESKILVEIQKKKREERNNGEGGSNGDDDDDGDSNSDSDSNEDKMKIDWQAITGYGALDNGQFHSLKDTLNEETRKKVLKI